MGVLQGAPQVHLVHGGKPCFVQAAVHLVQLVEVRGLGARQRLVGVYPRTDLRPLRRGGDGGEVPQDAPLHGGALVDQLVHDAPVQPGDGGALVGHDAHQPVFLQFLQHHPDQGARRTEPGAQRVLAQRRAGTDGQVDDLPFQHSVNFGISLVLLFHITHLIEMMIPLAGSPSPPVTGSVAIMERLLVTLDALMQRSTACALSVIAARCQLPQRGSQEHCRMLSHST